MRERAIFSFLTILLAASRGLGAEHRAEPLREDPPEDGFAREIRDQLAPSAIRVIRGGDRVICDIWLRKQWPGKPGLKPTGGAICPFQTGQLIGVVRYANQGGDFRDQDIAKGCYTLRYGVMPADGNHEGVFPTRDFLLLVKSEKDKSVKPMEEQVLWELAASAAGTPHPALLCVLALQDLPESSPLMRHNENRDWWMLRVKGTAQEGGKSADFTFDLVVAGFAGQ